MVEFHNTKMGQEFFCKNFPKLVKEVGRVADALEGKNILPVVNNDNTVYCQRIDENVFVDILNKITDGDVSVGYYSTCIPEFRSKKLNSALAMQEVHTLMKDVVKYQLGKNIKEVFDVHGRNGFVYIPFIIED